MLNQMIPRPVFIPYRSKGTGYGEPCQDILKNLSGVTRVCASCNYVGETKTRLEEGTIRIFCRKCGKKIDSRDASFLFPKP